MLTQDGFDALIAGSAGALDAAEDEAFAAILVDLQLPDADGIGLIRALRERPDTVDTPVVVSADVARGRARGRSREVIDARCGLCHVSARIDAHSVAMAMAWRSA